MNKQIYILMVFLISSAVINAADLGREFWKKKYLAACVDVAKYERWAGSAKPGTYEGELAGHRLVKQKYAQLLTGVYPEVYRVNNEGNVEIDLPAYDSAGNKKPLFTSTKLVNIDSQPYCNIM